jgi:hypothetical protein
VPRIQRFTHSIQRIANVNFFKPEPQDHRPNDVLTHDVEPVASFAAWSATSFSSFVPYRNPPTR